MTIHEWALVLFVIRSSETIYVTILIHEPFMDHLWKYTLAAPAPLSTWESTDRQGQAGVYPCSCCLEWWSMNTGWHIVGTA